MKAVVSVIALLATAALADVELTRNVDSLGDGVSIKAVLDSGIPHMQGGANMDTLNSNPKYLRIYGIVYKQ